ncbi:hypothetical protein M1N64_00275 [Peptococcaceae bacterium]|nr:hypothetical protein [Peptococcaceae bacterium]
MLKEKSFQTLIKEHLINENGYKESTNSGYNKALAIDEEQFFFFLEKTQPKETNRLKKIYTTNYHSKVLANLNRELYTRGSIDVLKHGIKDYGLNLISNHLRS